MKKNCAFLFLSVFVFLAVFRLPLSSGSESYVMVLRGGGNMTATCARVGGETIVNITFERSPHAANRQQPGPGQCAWLDRALTPDEQLLLQYKSKNNRVSVLSIKGGSIRVEKYEGNEGGKDLKYLIDAIHGGRLFYVHATRAKLPWGTDYLKITRIGP